MATDKDSKIPTADGRETLEGQGNLSGTPRENNLPGGSDVANQTVRTMTDLDEQVDKLSPENRAIAGLNFRKCVEVKTLPQSYRLIKMVIPSQKQQLYKAYMSTDFLRRHGAYLINPHFGTGTNSSEIVVATSDYRGLIQELNNLLQHPEDLKIYQAIPANVMRVRGGGVIDFGSEFMETRIDEILTEEPSAGPSASVEEEPSKTSILEAKTEQKKWPRKGECVYMAIDTTLFLEGEDLQHDLLMKKLILKISALAESNKFHVISKDGFLIVLNTNAQKAGDSLVAMAMDLQRASKNQNKILIGKADVEHKAETFEVNGLPGADQFKIMAGAEIPGTYLSTDIYERDEDDQNKGVLHGRIGGLNRYETDAIQFLGGDMEAVRIDKVISKVSLHVGGPDRMIGFEDKLAEVNDALSDEESNLILLKGHAGMGKSRLLSEVLKDNPDTIVLSMDSFGSKDNSADKDEVEPLGSKINGHSMVSVFNQVMEYVKNNFVDSDDLKLSEALSLAEQPDEQKLSMAQKNPVKFTEYIVKALEFLRSQNGELKIILDDAHYIDRHSDGHLMGMFSRMLMDDEKLGRNKTKVILSMRPEERYESEAQKALEETWQDRSRTVDVKGLKFSDPEIAHDFIYYSLPKELRGFKLGDWYKDLGKQAGDMPLAMTAFMDEILDAYNTGEPSLKEVRGIIQIDNNLLRKLLEGNIGGDLPKHYNDKLDKLTGEQRRFMNYLALLGGNVGRENANLQKIKALSGIGTADTDELQDRKYINLRPDGQFEIAHPLFRQTIVRGLDINQKIDLSMELFEFFKDDKLIHPDIKISILHNVALAKSPTDSKFWKMYLKELSGAFDRSDSAKLYVTGYGTAMSALGEEAGKGASSSTIGWLISQMTEGQEVSEEVAQIIIKSLFSKAENGVMIGKFEEVKNSVGKIEEIYGKNPALVGKLLAEKKIQSIGDARAILFEGAYITKEMLEIEDPSSPNGKRKIPMAQKIFEDKIENDPTIPEGRKMVLKLKTLYRMRKPVDTVANDKTNDKQLRTLNNPDSSDYWQYIEAGFIRDCASPYDLVRTEIENRVDEDVMMQPNAITPEQRTELTRIKGNIEQYKGIKKNNPNAFTPLTEMFLLDMDAGVNAFLGNHEEAEKIYSEYWRQATQVEMFHEAARAAKLKGDIQVVQALSKSRLDKGKLKKAIETYSEEGIRPIKRVSENYQYHFTLRVQRLRAYGLLLREQEYELDNHELSAAEKIELRQEMKDTIGKALGDFEYIMTGGKEGKWEKLNPIFTNEVVSYYVSPYLGKVLTIAKGLDMDIPEGMLEKERNPYADAEVGKEWGKKNIGAGLNQNDPIAKKEYDIKMEGLDDLASLVANHKQP